MTEARDIVRAMSVCSRLLTMIIEGLEERGKSVELLYFLQKARGRENLDAVIDLIASQSYAVPKSVVVKQAQIDHPGDEDIADFYWGSGLADLGIPAINFSRDLGEYGGDELIGDDLESQLHGKQLTQAMPIKYEDDNYLVVGWIADFDLETGVVIDMKKVNYLTIVRQDLIDLDS